ncbi:MAG: hypothetical protein V2B13_10525 [Pseudomonadota bacterium]
MNDPNGLELVDRKAVNIKNPKIYLHFFALLITIFLFLAVRYTSRFPTGDIIFLPTPRMFFFFLLFSTFFVSYVILIRWVLQWFNFPKKNEKCFYMISPIYILLLYPISIFVLHPLGCPVTMLVLFQPYILIAVVLGMIVYRSSLVFTEGAWFQQGKSFWNRLSVKWIGRILFLFFLLFFVFATFKENRIQMIVGDEPHYLQIMDSLRRYHTANLWQVVHDKKFDEGISYVPPHRSGQSVPGTIYSVHHIGLPLLMILPYFLGKFNGLMFFFNLVMAFTLANIFLFCFEVTGRKTASASAALLMGFSCPIIFYFRCIYPEVVAALFLVYIFRMLRADSSSSLQMFFAGCSAAFLPWLHVKFVLISALFAGLALFRYYRSPRRVVVFLIPFIPSVFLMMRFFNAAYGGWLPNAQYGEAAPILSCFFFRGAPGQWLDRDHGILAFAPFYFIIIPGLIRAFRQNRHDLILILFLILPSYAVVSSHWMWWGGPCPPGRFLLPFLPLLAPLVALGLTFHRHPLYHISLIFTVTITILLSILSFNYVDSLPFHVHFIRGIIPSFDAFPFFPQLFIHHSESVPIINYIVTVLWLGAALFLWCMHVWVDRRKTEPPRPNNSNRSQISFAALVFGVFFFFLWPGVCSLVDALGQGRSIRFSSNVQFRLPELNYYLDAFTRPCLRARIDPAILVGRFPNLILRASIPVKKKLAARDDAFKDKKLIWVMTGPYTTLYPVNYSLDYILTVFGEKDEIVGEVDASAGRGSIELAKKTITSQIRPESQLVNLSFHNPGIYTAAEFRCRLFRPATVIIERIDVRVKVPS